MEIILDVSELEPCEPLDRSLAATRSLKPGDYLRVIHRREPMLLYPMLEKTGFQWHTRAGGTSAFEVFIWRSRDQDAEQAVQKIIQN